MQECETAVFQGGRQSRQKKLRMLTSLPRSYNDVLLLSIICWSITNTGTSEGLKSPTLSMASTSSVEKNNAAEHREIADRRAAKMNFRSQSIEIRIPPSRQALKTLLDIYMRNACATTRMAIFAGHGSLNRLRFGRGSWPGVYALPCGRFSPYAHSTQARRNLSACHVLFQCLSCSLIY